MDRIIGAALGVTVLLAAASGCGGGDAGDRGATPADSSARAEGSGEPVTDRAAFPFGELEVFSFECAPEADAASGAEPVRVVASHRDPGRVWLFLPDRTVELPQVRSASGAKYSDGETVYWSKGRDARLELPDGTVWTCAEHRSRSAVEDAKLRRMDFLARGQEPGWLLGIGPDSLVYLADYGTARYAFPAPEPEVDDEAGTAVWRAASGGHELTVRVVAGGCRDAMSGRPYETSVELTFDGRTLNGCGEALH